MDTVAKGGKRSFRRLCFEISHLRFLEPVCGVEGECRARFGGERESKQHVSRVDGHVVRQCLELLAAIEFCDPQVTCGSVAVCVVQNAGSELFYKGLRQLVVRPGVIPYKLQLRSRRRGECYFAYLAGHEVLEMEWCVREGLPRDLYDNMSRDLS